MMERAKRYVFRPASVASLERRDVPSALGMPADLRNLSATITGSAHATPLDVAGPGDRQVDFSGAGKDKAGRPVGLSGSLISYDPKAYGALPGTFGSATLKTKHATYRFNLDGPPSDLNADSGLSNVTFWVSKARVGAPQLVVAQGSMQVHRQPGPGGEVFTATIVVSSLK
jgi:hypothetical protein